MHEQIASFVADSDSFVVIQADNPDGDSLASALALEQVLDAMGKQVELYCGVEIPGYLRHMPGWSRVQKELPKDFEASIIVDTSAASLLEQIRKSANYSRLQNRPCLLLDHHIASEPDVEYADIAYIGEAVSTGEIIYELSEILKWPRNARANDLILLSIMSDSLGLTSEGTSARSIAIVSELVEQGVSIPRLDNLRRSMQKKSPGILEYKGRLLQRVEYSEGSLVATVDVPWEEIEKFSPEYNPAALVIDEMRMVNDVKAAIVFKTYPDGKITAKIRTNYGFGIAAELASMFGGGGHPYAAGFKITDGRPFNEVKSECIKQAYKLILKIEEQENDETPQYAYTVN